MRPLNEIEETLRLARDEVERSIARYRIWFFAIVFLATASVDVARIAGGGRPELRSPIWFALCLLYAVGVRRLVLRLGARKWLSRAITVIDLVATVTNFLLTPAARRAETLDWPLHVAAGALLIVLIINLLRNDPSGAVIGSSAGFVICVAVLYTYEGWKPQFTALFTIFFMAGLVGVASARRARRTLELYGRMQLLRRYLPPAAVSRVLEDRPESALALGGQLVTVTLLASDLRGFTAMSERLSPEALVEELNAYHGMMLAQIDRHHGTLDKFIGDGMLAIFGLDVASLGSTAKDAGASAAVACARDMLRALEVHNRERETRGQAPLKLGVGIHTGAVVAGNVGAPERRLEFTVIGDAVNTAARLEGLTKEAGTEVLVSAETVARLDSTERLVELPAMKVRGKEEPVRVYALLTEKDRALATA